MLTFRVIIATFFKKVKRKSSLSRKKVRAALQPSEAYAIYLLKISKILSMSSISELVLTGAVSTLLDAEEAAEE